MDVVRAATDLERAASGLERAATRGRGGIGGSRRGEGTGSGQQGRGGGRGREGAEGAGGAVGGSAGAGGRNGNSHGRRGRAGGWPVRRAEGGHRVADARTAVWEDGARHYAFFASIRRRSVVGGAPTGGWAALHAPPLSPLSCRNSSPLFIQVLFSSVRTQISAAPRSASRAALSSTRFGGKKRSRCPAGSAAGGAVVVRTHPGPRHDRGGGASADAQPRGARGRRSRRPAGRRCWCRCRRRCRYRSPAANATDGWGATTAAAPPGGGPPGP